MYLKSLLSVLFISLIPMNVYSQALKHIDMNDVKQKHRQKLIEKKNKQEEYKILLEELKYKNSPLYSNWREEISEGMTSDGMFSTTLPATGAIEYPAIELSATTVSFPGYPDASLLTYDTSYYNELIYDVTIEGDTALVIELGGDGGPVLAIIDSSGTYTIPVPQSKNLQLLLSSPDDATGVVYINNPVFRRTTPLNVFVPLDSPEASAFIRTDPIMANLSPQERLKKLKDMLEASDEYVAKMLGLDFPGTGAVPPGEYDPFKQAPLGEAGDTPGVEMADYQNKLADYQNKLADYQNKLAAYEKAVAADKQKSDQLSKAVDAARAEYLKPGQTFAGIQQSYNKLQAAIKASTDYALWTLRNPYIKPTPPTPPATQTSQSKFTPQQLADIEKQIQDLQAQAEKNKEDAVIDKWKAAAELGLGVAGVVGGIGAVAKIPAAIRVAKTVSQVRQATNIYNTQKALDAIRKSADVKRVTTPGKYTAKPNPNRTPVKGGMMYKNSYEPQGQVLSEKKLKSPEEVLNKIPGYYDGKPAPLGFPVEPPPKMVNGMHPDLVDGKKVADRFNRLDPESAKAMPPTGNPHIDKKVRAAAKKPK